jgi:hypothetical protein
VPAAIGRESSPSGVRFAAHSLVNGIRRALVVVLLFSGAATGLQSWQQAPAPAVTPSPEEMEQFLLTARITRKTASKTGITNTIRATLTDGRITHDAQIQTVDIAKAIVSAGPASETNFKDTYRYNIGAYQLARLLRMTNVPMSVKRYVDGNDASVTWWVDDVQFDEKGRLQHQPVLGPDPERTTKQVYNRLVFDELIQNKDRNLGNMVWTTDWTLWLIDHTRAFRLDKKLMQPERLVRCERALLEAMRALTFEDMDRAMGDVMTKDEMNAVLSRRDAIVKHFADRIARFGEPSVLFTM